MQERRETGRGWDGDEDLSQTGKVRVGREGGTEGEMKPGEEERKPERRGEQREREKERQSGSGPGLSLAKVEAFASCQLETAALGQKDAALRSF